MTTETEIKGIQKRLDGLERQNRRLKQIGILLALIVVAAFVMGQTTDKSIVETGKSVLRDSKAKIRGTWVADGEPSLTLYGQNGRGTVSITSWNPRASAAIMLSEYSDGRRIESHLHHPDFY